MLSAEICIKLRDAGLKQYQPQTFDKIYVRFRDEEDYRLGVVVPTTDPSFDGHLVVTDGRGSWPLATFVDHVRIPSVDGLVTGLWFRDEAAQENTSKGSFAATITGVAMDQDYGNHRPIEINRALAYYYIKLHGQTK